MQIFKLSTITLALSCCLATACGPALGKTPEGEPCTEACLPEENAAVLCEKGASGSEVICAQNYDLASTYCTQVGGVPDELALCPEGSDEAGDEASDEVEDTAGTAEESEQSSWSPSDYVSLDPTSGVFVIDSDAIEALERDPSGLFEDGTHLELVNGSFRVSRTGPLAEAMGWEKGDILHALNGYEIDSGEDFLATWDTLSGSSELQLKGLRQGEPMILSYRLE